MRAWGRAVLTLPTPPQDPLAPPSCDLETCTCENVSLAELKALGVVDTGPDPFGYSYKINFCQEIPAESLSHTCLEGVVEIHLYRF